MKYRNGEADIILGYYAEGHTQAETMERFGITKNQLQYLAKRYKVRNGRTAAEICTVNGSKALTKQKEQARERLLEALNEIGLELISEYKGKETPVLLRCRTCGAEFKRIPHCVNEATKCPACKQKKSEERKAQAKAEAERRKIEKKEQRLIINPLGLSCYQLKRSAELDKEHTCRICGNTYTMRQYIESTGIKNKRVSGYCSAECRRVSIRRAERERRKREGINDNHYSRARKRNAPREKGITLPALIKRDGLQCAICGLMCIYGDDPNAPLYPTIDHIIPIAKGGGHTWDNVQVAHRQCNCSWKRDRILNAARQG